MTFVPIYLCEKNMAGESQPLVSSWCKSFGDHPRHGNPTNFCGSLHQYSGVLAESLSPAKTNVLDVHPKGTWRPRGCPVATWRIPGHGHLWYSFIYQYIYVSRCPSMHLCMYLCIYVSMYVSMYRWNQCIYADLSINDRNYVTINLWIYLYIFLDVCICLSVNQREYVSIYVSINVFHRAWCTYYVATIYLWCIYHTSTEAIYLIYLSSLSIYI